MMLWNPFMIFFFALLQGECTMLFFRFFKTVAPWSLLRQVSISYWNWAR
jgi:hypothetical protein